MIRRGDLEGFQIDHLDFKNLVWNRRSSSNFIIVFVSLISLKIEPSELKTAFNVAFSVNLNQFAL